MKSKQVIVIRSDLKNSNGQKVRIGKLISQSCHASLQSVLNIMKVSETSETSSKVSYSMDLDINGPVLDWINGIFTKICLSVDSEEELIDIYEKAKSVNLPCSIITDIGLTEFNGIPTKTAVAIGPAWDIDIDKITNKLKLL